MYTQSMVTEPDINQDELKRILTENYEIDVTNLSFIPKGEVSWGYVIEVAGGERYFLKTHKSKNLDPKRFQLLYNLHTKAGINNIIYPKPTKTGELEIIINGYPSVLFNYLEGKTVHEEKLNDEQYEKFGELLGQIHQSYKVIGEYSVKETFDIPQRPEFEEVMRKVESMTHYEDSVRQKALGLFIKLKESFYKELETLEVVSESLKKENVPFVLCHGEPSPGNIMVTPQGEVFLIDWDEPIMAPKEKDLLFLTKTLPQVFKGYSKYSSDTNMNGEVEKFYSLLWNVAEIADWGGRLFLHDSSEEELKHSLKELEEFLGYSGLMSGV